MNELGPGFLEKVYKNALLIAMRQKGLKVDVEHSYDVIFRGKVIGRYIADLVVNDADFDDLSEKACAGDIRSIMIFLQGMKIGGMS